MTKQIASIYFSFLPEIRRPLYQGYFIIPIVKKGEPPALLTIKDHVEINDLPFFAGVNQNRPYKQRVMILGEQIAQDVLEHWTAKHQDMSSECAPGMWIVRDLIYLFDEEGKPLIDAEGKQEYRRATAEEKAAMWAEDLAAAQLRQSAWIERAIRRGDMMADDPKKIPWIPQYCMDSVDYSGREREWRHGLREGDIKSCPFCTKSIARMAFKCPHCSEVVDPEGFAIYKARQGEAQRRAELKIAAELEADRLREENQRLRDERAAKKAALAEEGDRLVATAEARTARIAAEVESEKTGKQLAGAAK